MEVEAVMEAVVVVVIGGGGAAGRPAEALTGSASPCWRSITAATASSSR